MQHCSDFWKLEVSVRPSCAASSSRVFPQPATAIDHNNEDERSRSATPYGVRGRVKTIMRLTSARIATIKMLPSGPVAPPLRIGLPSGCVAMRWCWTMSPLSATPYRKDCAQSHEVGKPIAHHKEPVRHKLRQNTIPANPAASSPIGDSPGFLLWPSPKRTEKITAAVQKPNAVLCPLLDR